MQDHLPDPPAGFAHDFVTVTGLRYHFVRRGADVEHIVVLLAGFPESWFA